MFNRIRGIVRDYLTRRLRVPSIEACLRQLSASGFSPFGVYDVGAYKGDFAALALRIWPDAHVSCFEALESRKADLLAMSARHPNRITVNSVLLGAAASESMPFHVDETGSSVLCSSTGPQKPTVELPMTTIDHCRRMRSGGRCDFLKIDVQGYELNVLQGAEETLLQETQVVLAELNVLEIYANVPLFHEVIGWLATRGFVIYDIGQMFRRPLDGALWELDVVFARKDSPLRTDKRWKAD